MYSYSLKLHRRAKGRFFFRLPITAEIWALARYFKAVNTFKTPQGLDHIYVLGAGFSFLYFLNQNTICNKKTL